MPLIERTIRTGYDLVEEYVQAGRVMAEKLQPSQPAKPDHDGSGDRMAEYITHLAFGALEYVQTLSRSPAQPAPTGVAPPFAATVRSAANTRAKRSTKARPTVDPDLNGASMRSVQVSVEAAKPVRVTLQLAPQVGSAALQAHAARRARPGKGNSVEPGIAVQIRTTRQLLVAHVQVNSQVAKGQYRCLLVGTADNLPCGHLDVQVLGGKSQ